MKNIVLVSLVLAMYANAMNCIEAVFQSTELPGASAYLQDSSYGAIYSDTYTKYDYFENYIMVNTNLNDNSGKITFELNKKGNQVIFSSDNTPDITMERSKDSLIVDYSGEQINKSFLRNDSLIEEMYEDLDDHPNVEITIYVQDPDDELKCSAKQYDAYPVGGDNPWRVLDDFSVEVTIENDTIVIIKKGLHTNSWERYIKSPYEKDGSETTSLRVKSRMMVPRNIRQFDLKGRLQLRAGKHQKTFAK